VPARQTTTTTKRKPRAGTAAASKDGRSRRASSVPPPPTHFWPGEPSRPAIPWHPRYWRINWRRGLVRLWLLASIAWGGYWLYNLQLACAFWFAPWCESPVHVEWPNHSMALGLAMVLLSGPLFMLLVAYGTLWAVRGFRARRLR
jgi:hypothetical protein